MLFDTTHTYTPEQIQTLTSIWSEILKYCSLHHDPKMMLSFLNKCGVISIDEKHRRVEIGVPNEFVISQIKKFFFKTLKTAIQSTYNQHFNYELVIFEPFQSKVSNPLQIDISKLLKITAQTNNPIIQEKNVPSGHGGGGGQVGYPLQSHLTFETIVSGAHIDFALSAARAVAEQPGKIYNPLFIYGHVGLGKTHLLNSIGNSIRKHHHSQNILFLPTTQLIDEIVLAIRKNKLPALLSKFKTIDVLLLDDIQFLSDKEKTQEIFLNIFNEMQIAGKQIVLTSDKAPRELNNIEARLKSRFGLGLVCDISEPDVETRMAILQSKLAHKGEYIDPELLSIIATNITSNVRELEGALNILLTKRSLTKQALTVQHMHDCLRTLGYKI